MKHFKSSKVDFILNTKKAFSLSPSVMLSWHKNSKKGSNIAFINENKSSSFQKQIKHWNQASKEKRERELLLIVKIVFGIGRGAGAFLL